MHEPSVFKQLLDLCQDCVKELDEEGRITAVNEPGLALLGIVDEAELLGVPWVSLWPESYRPLVAQAIEAARQGMRKQFVAASEEPSGEQRWWVVTVGPLYDSAGKLVSIGAISREISERVRLERSLDTLNDALRQRLNAAERRLHQSQHRETVLHDELGVAEAALLYGDRENVELQDQLDLATLARSAAEHMARQSQKGEAIGQLVVGMGHDFNNNLQTVLSALDALAETGELSPMQVRFLGFAQAAAQHAAIMSRRLLAFSRVHPYRPEQLDLAEVIQEVVPLMSATLGKGMQVSVSAPGEGDALIFADGHSIQQGVMNLCLNAKDACGGKGHIRIEVIAHTVSASAASVALAEGDYWCVDVVDDGEGMSDEVKERLFQPFFTTKPEGKGTGLGMAQVLGLVRQANGGVDVESSVGQGTRVRLLFPRASVIAMV